MADPVNVTERMVKVLFLIHDLNIIKIIFKADSKESFISYKYQSVDIELYKYPTCPGEPLSKKDNFLLHSITLDL